MTSSANGFSVHLANPESAPTKVILARPLPANELRAATATAVSWPEWLQRAAQLTVDALPSPGVLVSEPRTSTQPARLIGITFPAEGLGDERLHLLRQFAAKALISEGLVIGSFDGDNTPQVAAITLPRRASPLVLLVLLENLGDVRTAAAAWLPLVAACAELWSCQHDLVDTNAMFNANAIGVGAEVVMPRAHADGVAVKQHAPKPTFWSRSKGIVGLSALAAVAMAVPVPYGVNCDCELQPVTRRFVAAPFEGALERALVEVGDTVAEGEVLAQMDGKEVRWELAGNAAEYERAAKERDAHLADQKFGEAQLAKLQMERLSLTTKLLDHRSENLEVRSPIAGIVVSGELKRAEGVRLSMGQTLFEVAPLDRMIVEVEIPESELANVPPNTIATIRLEAFPNQRLDGTLKRICPRAELRNKQQVFVGEIELPNDAAQLKPGMRGRVSLAAGQSTLGWRLFHRTWNKVRLWWGA
ncbi:MAG: efflux RND transporter periplasmic adaptor subunit [Planctomycetia bacterium]|nr:efflux RND transporter periplasmic adaptor subunit [Planctomycetia bacterium]